VQILTYRRNCEAGSGVGGCGGSLPMIPDSLEEIFVGTLLAGSNTVLVALSIRDNVSNSCFVVGD
jgi:hypothetical protein